MPRLTPSQLTTLKNHLAANTATVIVGGTQFAINSPDVLPADHSPPSDEAAGKVRDWYNGVASPSYWVFKPSLTRHELTDVPGLADDGLTVTNFVWGGTTGGFINRSQGERDAFASIFNAIDTVNPSRSNVRTAFDDIFSGSGAGAQANRAHFRAVARKLSLIGEKLFLTQSAPGYTAPVASGSRGATTNPDTLGVGQDGQVISALTSQDIKDAWGS